MKKIRNNLVVLLALGLFLSGCKTKIAEKHPKLASKTYVKRTVLKKKVAWQPLKPVNPQIFMNGLRNKLKAALTFDACETKKPAGYDEKIVKILIKYNAKATMFLGGKWMESHPNETKMLAKNSLFELGNHSYIHPDFTKITLAEAKQEILKPQQIMFKITGRQGILFRFPFGNYNKQVLNLLGIQGLKAIQWDVVTGDPDQNIGANDILQAVRTGAKPGSIIIMHMNKRGWHTAEALPEIIEYLRNKGFELVTVSELIKEDN
jgi:peptidoglycan/xylan/chitin deacetylase (PgdA/CDA1 family)